MTVTHVSRQAMFVMDISISCESDTLAWFSSVPVGMEPDSSAVPLSASSEVFVFGASLGLGSTESGPAASMALESSSLGRSASVSMDALDPATVSMEMGM